LSRFPTGHSCQALPSVAASELCHYERVTSGQQVAFGVHLTVRIEHDECGLRRKPANRQQCHSIRDLVECARPTRSRFMVRQLTDSWFVSRHKQRHAHHQQICSSVRCFSLLFVACVLAASLPPPDLASYQRNGIDSLRESLDGHPTLPVYVRMEA
jgi:hypothetical protein